MFVSVYLFCVIQSHGTSISVWGETSITGFVLHASQAHCPEMSGLPLICVSTHMPLWRYRTAPAANGVDAQRLKTNPSHRKKKKMVREEREGGLRGEAGGGEKNNGSSVLHSLKRLFITMVPLSGSLPVYPWGESNPCQTHLWAWTWRNGPSWSHTDGTAGDRRHMDVSCPALSRTSAMSRHSLELRSVLRWRSTHSTKQIWVFWWRCTSSYLTALERRRQTICFKLTL